MKSKQSGWFLCMQILKMFSLPESQARYKFRIALQSSALIVSVVSAISLPEVNKGLKFD